MTPLIVVSLGTLLQLLRWSLSPGVFALQHHPSCVGIVAIFDLGRIVPEPFHFVFRVRRKTPARSASFFFELRRFVFLVRVNRRVVHKVQSGLMGTARACFVRDEEHSSPPPLPHNERQDIAFVGG